MKLTPLDIHHKEFRRSLRGYDEKEVDDFLDEVAEDFERLFKENIELSEKLESANEQLRRYQVNEQTIQNTMLAAQRSAEDIVNKANADADQVLRDAELKAKEIIHNALQQKQRVAGELVRIKAAEEDFRVRFTAMLDAAVRQVAEVTIPQDVGALLSEPDAGVEAPAATSPAFASDAEPAQRELGEADSSAEAVVTATPQATAASAQMSAGWTPEPDVARASEDAVEPEVVVQSVQLGEVESPGIDPEVDLVEPSEFRLPTLDALGERDQDHDIEEID